MLHFVVLRETVQRQVFSRKFAKENITRSLQLDVRKSLRQQESVSSTNNL